MDIEKWSEFLADKDVLQYQVCWSSLTVRRCQGVFATWGTTGTMPSPPSGCLIPTINRSDFVRHQTIQKRWQEGRKGRRQFRGRGLVWCVRSCIVSGACAVLNSFTVFFSEGARNSRLYRICLYWGLIYVSKYLLFLSWSRLVSRWDDMQYSFSSRRSEQPHCI
jgi:hypothetical protein